MNQDVQKFFERLRTDEELQKKLETSAKNYTGEKTPEAVFENLVQPIAKEAGFSFTVDECREYETPQVKDLNPDEMDQVAGGIGGGAGVGGASCDGFGWGFGAYGGYGGAALCIVAGIGYGSGGCAFMGCAGVDDDD